MTAKRRLPVLNLNRVHELRREAGENAAHAASLLLDPTSDTDKIAAALVHCSVAVLRIAESDPSQRALNLVTGWLRGQAAAREE